MLFIWIGRCGADEYPWVLNRLEASLAKVFVYLVDAVGVLLYPGEVVFLFTEFFLYFTFYYFLRIQS